MNKPLVSVIVAAYNVEKYLGECLKSILAQDYDNFEVIVVDDASTDNTASIIDGYQDNDARVHVIHNSKNVGLSAVRNIGIDSSIGKYILFVDGDDLIDETLLSKTIYFAEINKLDELSFGYKIFTEEKELAWKKRDVYIEKSIPSSILSGRQMLVLREKMQKKANGNIASSCSWAWLYNRSFLVKNNLRFLAGIVHEDILFWFQCCLKAERVMMLEQNLYLYRKNAGSITTGWCNTRAKSLFSVISLIYSDWIKNRFTPEEDEAISSVLKSACSIYRKAELSGETDDMEVNPAIDFGYKFLHGQLSYKFGNLTSEAIDILRQRKNILVYGAGSAAADVFDQLDKINLKPMGVIVSHKMGNPTAYGGVPVKTLDEWKLVKNAIVILAVTGKYSNGIESRLRQYGYEQIINLEE